MKQKSFFLFRKTFSSFICRTEILKSFQFFATLSSFLFRGFPGKHFRRRLHWALAFEGRAIQGQMVCSIFMNVFHVYSFRKCCKTCFLQVNSSESEQYLRNFPGECCCIHYRADQPHCSVYCWQHFMKKAF